MAVFERGALQFVAELVIRKKLYIKKKKKKHAHTHANGKGFSYP